MTLRGTVAIAISSRRPSRRSADRRGVEKSLGLSGFETLSDGRDLRDVTGGYDGSAERDEGVDQRLELLVVKGLIGGEGDSVGAILDVVSDRPTKSRPRHQEKRSSHGPVR